MSLRDAYRQRFEAQIEEQRANLAVLKARAKRVAADGKIMAYEEIDTAEAKLAAAKGRLKELATSSDHAWEEMKGGMEKAWNELSTASKKAAAKFGAPDKDAQPGAEATTPPAETGGSSPAA